MFELLSVVSSILLVDIALNGDNALVIGAVAAKLSQRQRGAAIFAGGAGAAVLRVVLAFLASFLLLLPWLQAIGGVILLFIAIRLLIDRQLDQHESSDQTQKSGTQSKSRSFFSALLMILVADVTMSLDNVLAVGALAHGNLLALALGVLLSVTILLIGSALVAKLIKRLPWLLDVAALVLAWTSADMVLHDQRLEDILNDYAWTAIVVPVASLGIVIVVDALLRLRNRKQERLS